MKKDRCSFEVDGTCYCLKCNNTELLCDCKNSDGEVVRIASTRDIIKREKYLSDLDSQANIYLGTVGPTISVMTPTVINEEDVPASSEESMASDRFDTGQGVILPKI
jgi:hypothetical protein